MIIINKFKLKGLVSLICMGILTCSISYTSYAQNNLDSYKTTPIPKYGVEKKGEISYFNAISFISSNFHAKYYNNNGINMIWKSVYKGKYLVYGLTPPESYQKEVLNTLSSAQQNKAKHQFRNMGYMWENSDANKHINSTPPYRYEGHKHLKIYSVEPNDHSWRNLKDPTYRFREKPYGTISDKYFNAHTKGEWRYMGYTVDGDYITNPCFPNDREALEVWPAIKWDEEYKTDFGLIEKSPYDSHPLKLKWVKDSLIPAIQKEEAKYKKNFMTNPERWKNIFSLKSDLTNFTGVWQGTTNKGRGYMTVITPSPAQPNLRMTNLKIYDKTNKLIGEYNRTEDSNKNIIESVNKSLSKYTDKTVSTNNFDSIMMKEQLDAGEDYKIVVTVKNMTPPTHDTNYKEKLALGVKLAYNNQSKVLDNSDIQEVLDSKKSSTNISSIESGRGDSKITINNKEVTEGSIPAGATVTHSKTINIAESAQNYVKISSILPAWYYNKNDDIDTTDNDSALIFPVRKNNLKMESISLVDEDGNTTTEIKPVSL